MLVGTFLPLSSPHLIIVNAKYWNGCFGTFPSKECSYLVVRVECTMLQIFAWQCKCFAPCYSPTATDYTITLLHCGSVFWPNQTSSCFDVVKKRLFWPSLPKKSAAIAMANGKCANVAKIMTLHSSSLFPALILFFPLPACSMFSFHVFDVNISEKLTKLSSNLSESEETEERAKSIRWCQNIL